MNGEMPLTLIDASGLPMAFLFGLKPELGLTVRRGCGEQSVSVRLD